MKAQINTANCIECGCGASQGKMPCGYIIAQTPCAHPRWKATRTTFDDMQGLIAEYKEMLAEKQPFVSVPVHNSKASNCVVESNTEQTGEVFYGSKGINNCTQVSMW